MICIYVLLVNVDIPITDRFLRSSFIHDLWPNKTYIRLNLVSKQKNLYPSNKDIAVKQDHKTKPNRRCWTITSEPQIQICRDHSAKFLKNSFEELVKFGKFWKVFSYRNLEKTCFPN